jgi:hypothetical protein
MCGALMISKLPHYHTIYHILPQKENNTLSKDSSIYREKIKLKSEV